MARLVPLVSFVLAVAVAYAIAAGRPDIAIPLAVARGLLEGLLK
jgi:hypothetical protein